MGVVQVAESETVPLIALRLPKNMNMVKLMHDLTSSWDAWDFCWDPVLKQPERPMPFSFELGSCGIILAICVCFRHRTVAALNTTQDETERRPHVLEERFRLSQLDDIIS